MVVGATVLALRSAHGGGVESLVHSGVAPGADEEHVIAASVRTPSFADGDRDDRPLSYLGQPGQVSRTADLLSP